MNKLAIIILSSLGFLFCNSAIANNWRMVMGHACVSGSELGGSDSSLSPQIYLSDLTKKAQDNGESASGSIQTVKSKSGDISRVKFLLGNSHKANFIFVDNSPTCARFINYCVKNKYSSPQNCFSALYQKNDTNSQLSTSNLNGEMGESSSAVDKQLNIVYNKLIKEMPPQFKQKLIQSEQDWIKYRDSTVSITAWQEAGGSAQLLNQDGEYLSIEKSRLKFLKSLLN